LPGAIELLFDVSPRAGSKRRASEQTYESMSTLSDPDVVLTPGGVSPAGRLVVAVVPTYRSRETVVKVVRETLAFVDRVIVVDDACPDASGSLVAGLDPRVELLVNAQNLGVGGSTKAGFARAIELGAAYVVKVDSDDQMDPSYIPELIDALETMPELALAKGNRFVDSATLHKMPPLRLIGNSGLTF
jgi:dolichol-phosphate mannosyltransferase